MDVTQTAIVSVLKATVELDAMTATPDMRGMPQDYAKKVCTLLKEIVSRQLALQLDFRSCASASARSWDFGIPREETLLLYSRKFHFLLYGSFLS